MFRPLALMLALIGLHSFSNAVAQTPTAEPTTTTVKEETKKDVATQAPADPSGTWKWQYQFGDNKMDAKLNLDWNGKKLTGKYTAREVASEIRDGKLEKDQLSFSTRREINGNEFEVKFNGQVKQDEILG